MRNTISTNNTSTLSGTSFGDKNVRYKMDCYILNTFLLIVILLFIITTICDHYAKHRPKKYWYTNNIKMGENNELTKVCLKNRTC